MRIQGKPMMNYTVKGLISFLSAYGTLGDEWRLMGCSNLTWCCLFGWRILGWSAEWSRKMSSRGSHLNLDLCRHIVNNVKLNTALYNFLRFQMCPDLEMVRDTSCIPSVHSHWVFKNSNREQLLIF